MSYADFGGDVRVVEVADPAPPPDGVVVAVAASGLCRSDWHGWQGHDAAITSLPHVPGHEFAGTVVAVGEAVASWSVGDRATAPFVFGCGNCPTCRRGAPQVCPDQWQPGFHGWGSHAEFVALPRADANLVAVPDDLGMDVAAGLGCRFTTGWRAVVDRAAVRPDEWVVVHGCGGVGLSAVMVAHAHGARVVAVDPDASRRDRARVVGADEVVDPGEVDVVAAVRDLTTGGADVSIDAVGDAAVVDVALRGLAPGGRHVQVGLLPAGTTMPMDVVVGRELQVLGSHGFASARFPEVLAAVSAGTVDPTRLLGEDHTLASGARALVEPARLGPGFALVRPDTS